MEQAPPFVLVDTNIWIYKSRLFRTPLGLSFIYSIRRSKSRLLLPEILEKELVENFAARASELETKIRPLHEELRQLFGQSFVLGLPSESDRRHAFWARMTELRPLIVSRPLTLDQAREAIQRVVAKAPPSLGGREFKDCLLWEAARDAAAEAPVILVTEDLGFFEDRAAARGLWPILKQEVQQLPNPITLFPKLEAYLASFGVSGSPVDLSTIESLLEERAVDQIVALTEPGQATLHDAKKLTVTPYLTDSPDVLAYSFEIVFEATVASPDDDDDLDGEILAAGELLLNVETTSVEDIMVTSLWFVDREGKRRGGFPSDAADRATPRLHLRSPLR